MITLNRALFLIPAALSLVFAMGSSYAEPMSDLRVSVIDESTIKLEWNHDKSVARYVAGCVSCMPNLSVPTIDDNITLDNVTPFPNTSLAMLYLIAYDSQNEIIHAKQVYVDLKQ